MAPISKLTLLALVTLTCAGAAGVTADRASACSCMLMDPAERLENREPALIGEVTARKPVDPSGDLPPGAMYEYTVRVERELNVDLPETITLSSYVNGAACGFEWKVGQRVGAFLYREADGWATNLCLLVRPARLTAAADGRNRPVKPDPRLRLRVSSGGQAVRAAVGVQPALDRLHVRPGARIQLRSGTEAERIVFRFVGRDGKRFGKLRRARRVHGAERTWAVRLPSRLPSRAGRLGITVRYPGGRRIGFTVGLTWAEAGRTRSSKAPRCVRQPS